MKAIHVVGAVINNDKGEFLCALRSPSMSMPNLWEFPGGKIEEGETPEESLIREIDEELGCQINVFELVEEVNYEYSTICVHLLTYHAEIIKGVPKAKEHTDLRWVPVDQLLNLTWAPADIPTVKKLHSSI